MRACGSETLGDYTEKQALLSFRDGVQVNDVNYRVNSRSRNEYTGSRYTSYLEKQDLQTFSDKMRTAANAGDVITATTDWARDGGLKHERKDNFVDFLHGDVLIQSGTNQYTAETVVGITGNGDYVFYDIVDMQPTDFTTKKGIRRARCHFPLAGVGCASNRFLLRSV